MTSREKAQRLIAVVMRNCEKNAVDMMEQEIHKQCADCPTKCLASEMLRALKRVFSQQVTTELDYYAEIIVKAKEAGIE